MKLFVKHLYLKGWRCFVVTFPNPVILGTKGVRTPESVHMKKGGYTYIIANRNQTLYTGVTSDLVARVYQHKNNLVKGFTQKYNLHMLVYYELFETIEQAIIREKQIKNMNRTDKLRMIFKFNSKFEDLYGQILDKPE